MPEIDFEAHIRLESFLDTDYSAYVAVQSEVEKAVTEMRDKEAMELFGMTYTAMNNFYQQKKTENTRSEEHTSELQSRPHLVCRLLLEKKKKISITRNST